MLNKKEISHLNEEYPINIKPLKDLIDRVHARYPLATKYEIAVVIKKFFEQMRDLLAEGNTICINGFFSSMVLIYFSRIRLNKYYLIAKVKLTTPRKMKK